VLEPYDGKLSRTVLRGERSRKAPDLPGSDKRKAMKTIDEETGAVTIDGVTMIGRGARLEDALAAITPVSENTIIDDMKNDYAWLRATNTRIGNHFFNFGFCFNKGKLESIEFVVSGHEIHGSWKDWSEENELSNKKLYEKWLMTEVDGKEWFDWGTIKAIYDRIGGGSFILLKYK
jgi:hypothetical protein